MDKIWDSLTRDSIACMSRADCIALLSWNDHNGVYTDEDSAANEIEPLTVEGAREYLIHVRFGEVA